MQVAGPALHSQKLPLSWASAFKSIKAAVVVVAAEKRRNGKKCDESGMVRCEAVAGGHLKVAVK